MVNLYSDRRPLQAYDVRCSPKLSSSAEEVAPSSCKEFGQSASAAGLWLWCPIDQLSTKDGDISRRIDTNPNLAGRDAGVDLDSDATTLQLLNQLLDIGTRINGEMNSFAITAGEDQLTRADVLFSKSNARPAWAV